MQRIYPERIFYGRNQFTRKECEECSATFWHVDPKMKSCGSNQCNLNQTRSTHHSYQNWTLKDTLSSYESHFKNLKSEVFKKSFLTPRSKMYVKHSTTGMYFLCAGCSAFESMVESSNPRKKFLSGTLFISNNFCYRFLDKSNVGATNRHSTGFFMLGLHCFQNTEVRFPLDWKETWVNCILGYFIEGLKLDPSCIYLHADSWNDGKRGGPSVEFFLDGTQMGNCVFTERDLLLNRDLPQRYLDVGLGLQRIHQFLTRERSVYFEDLKYDHLRSLVVGLKDNLFPSKIGVGYNLRKLCETVLKEYLTEGDMSGMKSDLERVHSDLESLLNQGFSERELDLSVEIIDKELKRCKTSNII